MPQAQLPIFPAGVTHITHELAFETRAGRVTYFNGSMPVFVHDETDVKTFRMITSQFCVNGNVKQADIVKAFGVTGISVKRSVALYRQAGPSGFYSPRKTRGGAVLTAPVVAEAQADLALERWRATTGGEQAALIGRIEDGPARVLLYFHINRYLQHGNWS